METSRTPVDIASLYAAVRRAWTADTSVDSGWTSGCPALGQCAVTALVIQDYLGGRLLRADVEGTSHYWNLVRGKEIDLTREQFTRFVPRHVVTKARYYVLSFPDTARRYEALRDRVALILRQEKTDAEPGT